jgi:uncharacterized protein
MNRNASLFTVLFFGFCLMLGAQRRDEGVEVKLDGMEATPIGVSVTLRASGASDSIHMMIGFPEGQSIARAMRHEKPERPQSHDLFKSFLERNGWRVQKVLIRDLKEGTFLADLMVANDRETQIYDARPSDAMAIGLRFGAKIYVNRRVWDEQKKSEGGEEEEKSSKPDTLKL